MTIELLDYQPHGVPDGDVFTFRVDDHEVVLERWSTDSDTGMDVYDKTTHAFIDLGLDTASDIDAIISQVDALWASAWLTHIQPIYEREVQNILSTLGQKRPSE